MKIRIPALAGALLVSLSLMLGAGSAFAGDGKSCGGKKKGESAATAQPVMPQA